MSRDAYESYGAFAAVYDLFMDDVPYDAWCAYICGTLSEYGIEDGLLLDLGCGTGTLTERLAEAGYDCIGVDLSGEMLEAALEKRERSGRNILYLQQDMRAFELYGTVGAVVSVCDSVNYITEKEDLTQVFRLVNNYLDPGGIFLFDLNTPYKFREVMGDCVIAENREEASFIWENAFYEEERMNEYDLTLFVRNADGLFVRSQETHLERAWELSEIKECLSEAGMEFLCVYDGFTKEPPRADSERITVIARERGKERT